MGDFKTMQSFIWMLLFVFLIFVPGSTLNAIEKAALTATTATQQTKTTSTTIKTTASPGVAVAEIAVKSVVVTAAAASTTATKTSPSLLKDSTSINDTIFLKTYSITQPIETPTPTTRTKEAKTTTTTRDDAPTTTATQLLTNTIPAGSLVRKATNVSISKGTKASLNSSSISRSRDSSAATTTTTIVKKSTTVAVVETAIAAAAPLVSAVPPASAAQTIIEEEQVTIAAQLVATLMSIAAANNEKILNNDNGDAGAGDVGGGNVVAVSSSVDNKVIYNTNGNNDNKNSSSSKNDSSSSSSNFKERSLSRQNIIRNNVNDKTTIATSSDRTPTTIDNSIQQTSTNLQQNQHFRPLQKPKIYNGKRNDHQQQQQQQQQQHYIYAHQQYQQQQLKQEEEPVQHHQSQQPQHFQQYERQYKQQYTREVQQLHAPLVTTATPIATNLQTSLTTSPPLPPLLFPSSTSNKHHADNLWAATIAASNRNLIIIADKNVKKENILETEIEKNNLKSIATTFEIAPTLMGTTIAATSLHIVTVAPTTAIATTPAFTLPPPIATTTRRRFIATTTTKPAPAIDDYQTIISQAGTHAYLPCNVKQLVKKPISWLRVRDGHILTVDQTTFIADQRFQSIYASNPERWSLQIKYVQLKDAGTYECQVSTEPKASAIVNLRIVEPKTELIGEPTRHVKAGSQVKLHCIISQALEPPLFINWFYNQKQIYLHNRKGWRTEIERIELPPLPPPTMPASTTTTTAATQADVMATTTAASSTSPIQAAAATLTTMGNRNATATTAIETTRSVATASMSLSALNGSSTAIQPEAIHPEGAAAAEIFAAISKTTTTTTTTTTPLPIMDVRQITTASLIIPAVEKLDSGNYTCIPSNSAPKTVVLHVLNGEYSASAITSGVNSNMIISSNNRNNNKQRHLLPWQQLHTAATILTFLWIIEFVLVEENIWTFRRQQSAAAAVVKYNKNSSVNCSSTSKSSSNRNNRIVAMVTQFSRSTNNSNFDSCSSNSNSNSNNECIISTTQIAEKT